MMNFIKGYLRGMWWLFKGCIALSLLIPIVNMYEVASKAGRGIPFGPIIIYCLILYGLFTIYRWIARRVNRQSEPEKHDNVIEDELEAAGIVYVHHSADTDANIIARLITNKMK